MFFIAMLRVALKEAKILKIMAIKAKYAKISTSEANP